MSKNTFILIGVMVVIGLISALLTFIRSERMAPPAELAAKGLAAIQKGNLIFFGIFMPILVGSIAFFVYRGMLSRSPDTAQTTYLLLAAGIAIAFTILAAAIFRMRGFVEFTTLHILYAAGFGWIMPKLLNM